MLHFVVSHLQRVAIFAGDGQTLGVRLIDLAPRLILLLLTATTTDAKGLAIGYRSLQRLLQHRRL